MPLATDIVEHEKCILCTPFDILLWHITYKLGLLVDLAKIEIIVNLPLPTLVKEVCTVLGNIRYYRKFIRGYVEITVPLEKLLENLVECI